MTGSRGVSDSGAYFQADEAGERDPMGIAFGPPTLLFPAEGLPDEGGPSVRYGAGVPNGQCTLDGMTVDCADANQLMRHGLLAHAPEHMVGVRNDGTLRPYTAVLGPGGQIYTGYMAPGSTPSPDEDDEEPLDNGIRYRYGDGVVRLRRDPRTDLPFRFGRSFGTAADTIGSPCKPTVTQLADHPEVRKGIREAWKDSLFGTPFAHEEGGWIFADNSNNITVVRMPSGTAVGIPESINVRFPSSRAPADGPPGPLSGASPNSLTLLRRWRLVGTFHTHPFTAGDPVPAEFGGGRYTRTDVPSPDDLQFSRDHGNIPGIIRTQIDGKPRIVFYPKGLPPDPRACRPY